jgi:hypothetical protein
MSQRRSRIEWEHHLARQKKSGLTIKAYSQREGFSSWSFYRNRTKLRQQTRFSGAKGNTVTVTHSSFIPVGTLQSRSPQMIIHFPDHTSLEIHDLRSIGSLQCILSTLQKCSGGQSRC